MLAYIKGELVLVTEDGIVVENNGLGYTINVPLSVMNELPILGGEIKIYTYLYVREDALKLYGFLTKDDLNVFKLLITVNGIGPKGALGVLSAITPDDLRFAVLADDVKAISKAPGIGTKTASKLILELKDKLKLEDAFDQRMQHQEERATGAISKDVMSEAVQALVSLGYSNTDALKAVRKVEIKEDTSVEELLKLSLKYISL
ncbi:MAG: Holliday junction branch migration protein RuvA [Velocimicrobium sp.]